MSTIVYVILTIFLIGGVITYWDYLYNPPMMNYHSKLIAGL